MQPTSWKRSRLYLLDLGPVLVEGTAKSKPNWSRKLKVRKSLGSSKYTVFIKSDYRNRNSTESLACLQDVVRRVRTHPEAQTLAIGIWPRRRVFLWPLFSKAIKSGAGYGSNFVVLPNNQTQILVFFDEALAMGQGVRVFRYRKGKKIYVDSEWFWHEKKLVENNEVLWSLYILGS